ncbi:MAG TPA: D-glycero-beta-D-manno-heptose 1,7-bisphosphate 7-phosphatase [Alphaproteobacteria bacterium]|jgi:D-glycero-D-manno-heptose 1,7-bisphosphate phosphatase|nr:D-glycero-beta-D-manno-heptose 1,7-bisphosphate 7-phosphatase [Alphaproteobacteria bacterium]
MALPSDARAKPAIFVDRDGVVLEMVDYLNRVDQVALAPGVAEAIRAINDAGVPLVIVTNQSAIARGMLTEAGLETIHARMKELLAAAGARIDAIYYCPHHPEAGESAYRRDCECRKPKPGMLREAANDLGLDLSRSVMVGDHATDIEAGANAGVAQAMLVLTGHGQMSAAALRNAGLSPSATFADGATALRAALDAVKTR